jgi:cell division protein FtsX
MEQIKAGLERNPLTRVLRVSGPANDFQQAELARILSTTPGVSRVRWPHEQGWSMPLLAELGLLSLLPFLAGLLFSYLVEVRRRANAEWSWG